MFAGALSFFRALGPVDFRNIHRDPLLRWMVVYPLLLAALIRWGLPAVTGFLAGRYAFDLVPYFPLLASFAVMMSPMLAGMVVGFLLLDQKDDSTLLAIRVVPLPLNAYLVYRLGIPVLIGFCTTLIIMPVSGIGVPDTGGLTLAALVAAPLAPLYALALAGFASNKVEGFALTKALGVLLAAPVLALFIPAPWRWCLGIVPHFWVSQVCRLSSTGDAWSLASAAAIGLGYQGVILWVLVRRYNRVAGI